MPSLAALAAACAAPLRLKKQNLADKSQRVGPAFFRRDKKLDAIAEEKESDLVVVSNGAEGEQTGDLGRELALGL